MLSFNIHNLNQLAQNYTNLRQKLEKTAQDITLFIGTYQWPLNLSFLAELLHSCIQAVQDAKFLALQYRTCRQQGEKWQREVKLRQFEVVRLLQENQGLNASIQQVRTHYEVSMVELETKYLKSKKEVESEARAEIEETQFRLREAFQLQLKRYQQKIDQKQTKIIQISQQLAQVQGQNALLKNQIQLAEIAVSDLWSQIQGSLIEKRNNLWDTYSPSPNSSQSSIRLSASNIMDLNRKRSSLMQDFFQSEITYNEPLLTSKLQIANQTLEQINGQPDQNLLIINRSLDQFSPTSNSSHSKCINCKLKSIISNHQLTNSVAIQAYDQHFVKKAYKWLKSAIVDHRIKKQ